MAGTGDPEDTGSVGAPGALASLPDHELLARHVAGEHQAFGELVRRHQGRLWAVALRTLGDREEAADALQDALVAAFRAAHTFQGRSAVTTWLHRIVVNACLDRARRAAVRRTRPLEDEQSLEAVLEPAEGADSTAERAELRAQLGAALAQLPAEQRAALVLVDLQGYSVTEAAAVLSVAPGTIKSRCSRGRARLLPLLGHLRAVSRETGPAGVSRETAPPSGAPVSRETGSAEGVAGGVHAGGNREGDSPVPPPRPRGPAGRPDRPTRSGRNSGGDARP